MPGINPGLRLIVRIKSIRMKLDDIGNRENKNSAALRDTEWNSATGLLPDSLGVRPNTL